MKKVIRPTEPILPIGGETGCKNPHYVTTVEHFNSVTREVKFKCLTNQKDGLKAILPEGSTTPKVGDYALLQRKFVEGATDLLKLKDLSPNNVWEDGREYSPSLSDSILLAGYKNISFRRELVA